MADAKAVPGLVTERRGAVGLITLDRPEALNALSLAMILGFESALIDWMADPRIHLVVVRGRGERAFCAGGDIRALYEAGPGAPLTRDFYQAEYRLNWRLFWYPKPVVALVEGIVMGGGVGVSIHNTRRFAGERIVFAMPETSIGFFPDVGATWILPQLPGACGRYLGLTGARLGAPDLLQLGLVHGVVPYASHEAFLARLVDQGPGDGSAIDAIAEDFVLDPGRAPIAAILPAINEAFLPTSVGPIIGELEDSGEPWAREAARAMSAASPTSLKVALRQIIEGRHLVFDEAMRLEYRLSQRFMASHDFFEGVRARVIDKDQAPRWRPARLEEVDERLVDRYFAGLGADELVLPSR
jgi:enoyl-CoA hydratase/carnithine racemase